MNPLIKPQTKRQNPSTKHTYSNNPAKTNNKQTPGKQNTKPYANNVQ